MYTGSEENDGQKQFNWRGGQQKVKLTAVQ